MSGIRVMARADLDLAVEWAAREGWNPGLADADAFWGADPGGYLIAEDADGPAAVISCVRSGRDLGFIGFYIALPEKRGRGFGIAIWRAAMARLEGRLVGLDGVIAQQDNYRKSGFALAWRNIRHVAAAPRLPGGGARGVALVSAASLPFEALAACDRWAFPAPREAFLRAWTTSPRHVALAALRDGHVVGWGCVRPAREGWKIGPLVADGPAVAETLVAALGAAAGAGPLVLDVPEPNAAALRLAAAAGMAPVFETARMYTGPAPPMDLARLWGITSFELG